MFSLCAFGRLGACVLACVRACACVHLAVASGGSGTCESQFRRGRWPGLVYLDVCRHAHRHACAGMCREASVPGIAYFERSATYL